MSKQILRKERKKKKVATYIKIFQLNKMDLKSKRASCGISNKHKSCHSDETDDIVPVRSSKASDVRDYDNSPHLPKLKLKMCGISASLTHNEKNRIPLFVQDIRHLLMYALLGQRPDLWSARWCNLEKWSCLSHVVVMVIENLSLNDLTSHSSKFKHMILEYQLEVVAPVHYNGNLVHELLGVSHSKQLEDNHILRNLSLKTTDVATSFCIPPQKSLESTRLPKNDTFSRTLLLLSVRQLAENNYPLPVKDLQTERYAVYKFTKNSYKEVTSSSPMYALDCEMCKTTSGLEVTRICVVDESLRVIYKTFVKPYNMIIDYLTRYSGVSENDLADLNVRLEDVQNFICNTLPEDAILVGQSLNFDLHALKLVHPFIIDTSVIYNLSGNKWRKSKLAVLSQTFLHEEIQKDTGHDPEEDSISALKLVQLKLQKGLNFGDMILTGRRTVEKSQEFHSNKCMVLKKESLSSPLTYLILSGKSVAVVADTEIMEEYHQCLSKTGCENSYSYFKCHVENSSESIVQRTCEHIVENHLSLAHIKCPFIIDDEICTQLDKFCCDIWERVCVNGMCIILLGGKDSSNGLAFVQIKR